MGLDMTETAPDWRVKQAFDEYAGKAATPDTYMVGLIRPQYDSDGTAWGHEGFAEVCVSQISGAGTAEMGEFARVAEFVHSQYRGVQIVRILDLSKPYDEARVVRSAPAPTGSVQ